MSAKPPKDVSDAIRLAGPEAVLAALEAAPDYAEAQPEAGNPDAPRRPLADILADLRDLFARFLFFPSPSCAPVLALWTAHTYALDAFTFTPYLAINSPVKRCGKTTLLDLLGFVVHQPLTAASISPAALFRVVEAERPTLLLDETDSIFASGPLSETAEALRGVLNSGFQANGRVTRCVGPNHDVAHFSTFCPKALAGIGTLPDTVRDRSISLPLARKPKNWQAPRLRRRDIEPTTEALRRQLVTWADGESVELLRVAQPALPDPLNDRQCDIAEPLLAIADMAGGDWPAVARRALCELCAGTAGDEGGLGAMLLRDIQAAFKASGEDKLPTAEIIAALVNIEGDGPWAHWWERDLRADNTKGPAASLAKHLKAFAIIPGSIRFSDGSIRKGYRLEDFTSAFSSYL